MGFSFKKLMIGGLTAAAIATTAVTTSISASNANTITVSPTVTSAKAGESFDVMIGYEPGSDGVAAFTIDLHYDSDKLEVYEPTSEELEGKYDVSTKFSYVSFNYTYSESVVRITGYSINNVKTKSNLALVTFKVKSGAKDSAGFWIDVDTMTTVDSDGNLKDASYSVPTKTSMVKLPIKTQSAATTTTSKKTTAASAVTTVVTNSGANNPVTTTASTTKATTTTTPKETSAPSVNTTTENAVTTSAPQVTTPADSTTEAVTTIVTEESTLPDENEDNQDSEEDTAADLPLFEFTQSSEEDFAESDESNYKFNLGEYVSDFSKGYDIEIYVKTTGSVNGAIGFNDASGSWTSQNFIMTEAGEDVWLVDNVILNENDADVYVPIYYVGRGATFSVMKVVVRDSATKEIVQESTVTEDEIQPEDEVITDESTSENGISGATEENNEDVLPDSSDENPNTTAGMPLWMIVSIPVLMIGAAVVSVVKIRKKIK